MKYYSEETVKNMLKDTRVEILTRNRYGSLVQDYRIIRPKVEDYPSIEIPESPWHTGTPTEEGWYLIAFLGANKRIEYASAVWCYNEWDAHCRILAWQKIEPYKEKTE